MICTPFFIAVQQRHYGRGIRNVESRSTITVHTFLNPWNLRVKLKHQRKAPPIGTFAKFLGVLSATERESLPQPRPAAARATWQRKEQSQSRRDALLCQEESGSLQAKNRVFIKLLWVFCTHPAPRCCAHT